ncbi:MAG: XRE family transcriptional regulator [Acidobacteria bacterium]|nr:XRE family transcriptional regulator [Acidobacteriota bacterium]
MEHRHLDYPPDTAPAGLGAAALDDLLDRGDLAAWAPLAAAVRRDPAGPLAAEVLRLCDAHPMYGTSILWTAWIERLRAPDAGDRTLGDLRRDRGLTQEAISERLGISQSDVSKIERRSDVRLSTLRAYVAATGGKLELRAVYPEGSRRLSPPARAPRRARC